MLTRTEARKIALALPQAKEADHHGRPSFRVNDKVFATFWDDATMNIMVDEAMTHRASERFPRACQPFQWGSRIAALNVRLSEIEADVLRDLLHIAWTRTAPKGLRDRAK